MQGPTVHCPPIGMKEASREDREHVSAHGSAQPYQTELGESHTRAVVRPRHSAVF